MTLRCHVPFFADSIASEKWQRLRGGLLALGYSGRMGVPRFPGRISMGPNEKDAAEIERA